MEGSSQAPLVTGHAQNITGLALPQPDSQALMATTAQDGILRIWQMPSAADGWHQVRYVKGSGLGCTLCCTTLTSMLSQPNASRHVFLVC